MKAHPYIGLKDYQMWKKSFGPNAIGGLDPVSSARFIITPETKIVAAGSCFAQHLARHIKKRGFNFVEEEKSHPIFWTSSKWPESQPGAFNYGNFSARYGNIYTARQLRQLIERAYGRFSPESKVWQRPDGRYVDPFRPQVEPDGFVTERELELDRAYHLAAVQRAIETADVFVFTMGLTETWMDRRDGAVFPVAPGVAGGVFDPSIHKFTNFSVENTVKDMTSAIQTMREINPTVRVLLTVSPVPLNATYEPRHVLQSTVYSKSVLRVAAQELYKAFDFVDYFPSYEIITSPHCGGKYFDADMRSIKEIGVEHVMGVFFKNYTNDVISPKVQEDAAVKEAEARERRMDKIVEVLCDEEAIDNEPATN
jgi:hypothetical protein